MLLWLQILLAHRSFFRDFVLVCLSVCCLSSGSETLDTVEAIEAFEAQQELETAEFIQHQSEQTRAVNAVAGELKFAEAQLTQRQKELRAEITAKRQELSFVAKYCELAETREAQVCEAQRTLATLQRQLDVPVPVDAAAETERHVCAESREEF